jgi:hypothetical protein
VSDIAKNLLADKVCSNCLHYEIEFNGNKYCNVNADKIGQTRDELPKENTCSKWQKADSDAESLRRFYENMLKQRDLTKNFTKIINENIWDLLEDDDEEI